MFVISLAVSDLLFASINLPLTASRYIYEEWKLGDILCRYVRRTEGLLSGSQEQSAGGLNRNAMQCPVHTTGICHCLSVCTYKSLWIGGMIANTNTILHSNTKWVTNRSGKYEYIFLLFPAEGRDFLYPLLLLPSMETEMCSIMSRWRRRREREKRSLELLEPCLYAVSRASFTRKQCRPSARRAGLDDERGVERKMYYVPRCAKDPQREGGIHIPKNLTRCTTL